MVGDHSKDVIVHLHYIMASMDIKQNKSVLWAYKNKLLNFTSCDSPSPSSPRPSPPLGLTLG